MGKGLFSVFACHAPSSQNLIYFLTANLPWPADFSETYKRSRIRQLRVLLGSIFPSGLAWKYEGTLNHKISPIYQPIRNFEESSVSLSSDL
ncbi:MAG: hypothetical protein UT54_C0008G0001 [Candidatus Daviesbacteria bacterium GW2011_GWB1_39_5]|nr:MAG: hypothetical protein UT04_C0006G0001 [Candidatus Daviesbacteria bacterium GW2011_GWF2_38_7]KKR17509.1 MAG: hypothetical protein UT45_C0001G0184 [Candidatus Daviesbacteria bacterium GW2011_GWA2_39_33]KKR25006.1 MAG: hypothetical protein UT54_C0008G0001 [Candidatus Daviesbacteria bacterium GW2011_GWB1_39_5]OGE21538.1 MAG: hypothetical protein A2778_05100 [Candidatus Daviesbacteria bacterium RIFCSPHIGHO2_01_FULL_40_24]OGE29030.1 MAG: hypothetical protein A3C29_06625 [Candidatus Daviesbacte